MPTEDLHRLLDLYRARLAITRKIMERLTEISPAEVEATMVERQKWKTREGQEVEMIDRLSRRLGNTQMVG